MMKPPMRTFAPVPTGSRVAMFTAPEGAARKARLKVEVPCEFVAKSWILPRITPPASSGRSGPM